METLNKKDVKVTTRIELKDLKIRVVKVAIIGISPLLANKFSNKVKEEIAGKEQGKAKASKNEIRNPEKEYEEAKHISIEGWEGFPAGGIKKCLIRGAKAIGLVMTDVKAGVFVEPDCPETDLVRIIGESRFREDVGRNPSTGKGRIIYRAEFPVWEAILTITFNEGLVSLDQVFQMIYAGGYGTGIGDWRPERGGNYGRFTLKDI